MVKEAGKSRIETREIESENVRLLAKPRDIAPKIPIAVPSPMAENCIRSADNPRSGAGF